MQKKTTIEWLSHLISFDTTSRNSNLALIETVKEWFEKHHLICRLTFDPNEEKANLFATIPAADGNLQGGLIFSGHTDTVPVDGQNWDTSPFEAVTREGCVYGRGTADMKGYLAVLLSSVTDFQKAKLKQPLHFAFSYDEEIGCRGVPYLIADLKKAGIHPKACIVGEPTHMRPVIAHKGIQVCKATVKGFAAHSSLTPNGCNAIEYASQFICELRKMADKFKLQGPFDSYFDIPYTTVSTNKIQGGIAVNTIPEECEFFFEFRYLPGLDPQMISNQYETYLKDQILPQMKKENKKTHFEITNIASSPAFEASKDEAFISLVQKLLNDYEIRKVAYGTEAGLFQQAGISTIVCGPGNIEQAHKANEFVTLKELDKCESLLKKIVQTLNGS